MIRVSAHEPHSSTLAGPGVQGDLIENRMTQQGG